MHSIDSIENYAYGTSEDIIHVKEKIKRINIIKQYKNIQIGQKFLTIHIEYH